MRISHSGSVVMNPTSIHEDTGAIPGLAQCVMNQALAVSCVVSHRCSLDPAFQWLWCRPVATALIQSLAWEPPNTVGAAIKRQKKKKKKKKKEKKKEKKNKKKKKKKTKNKIFRHMISYNPVITLKKTLPFYCPILFPLPTDNH